MLGKPPLKAPGLSDYPASDAQVKSLAGKLWGTDTTRDRTIGKGRVLSGMTPAEVLATMKVQPDFVASRAIRHIHRELDDREVYFVANPEPQVVDALCSFRVSGMTAEAWFPDTGRIEPIAVFVEADGCTRIPLRFEPSGSMLVVFKKGRMQASERIVSVQRTGQELIDMGATGKPGATSDVTQTLPGDRPHADQGRFAVIFNNGIKRTDSKNLKNSESPTSSVG